MSYMIKNFNGKPYNYYGGYSKKSTATNVANRFRAKGKLVRTIAKYGVWIVYVR